MTVPTVPPPRYDPARGIYRDCRFCRGRGCLACPGEAAKAYDRERPQLLAEFRWDSPQDLATMRAALHVDRIRHAFFSPDGSGQAEIEAVLRREYGRRLCTALRARLAAGGIDRIA